MNFLSKLFKGRKDKEVDYEKAVGKWLLELPRCSNSVVITSPKYGDVHYFGEVIVSAEYLLRWSEHHCKSVVSSNYEAQAASLTLPLWLRGADLSDNTLTYIPTEMSDELKPYTLDFIKDGEVRFYCPECNSIYNDIKIIKHNEVCVAGHSSWEEIWKCKEGHVLYNEEIRMTMTFSR